MLKKQPRVVELDVRPFLREKKEPFQLIMDQVKALNKEDTFILHATFKPTPLLGLLKLKGYGNEIEKVENDHWIVTFRHKSQKNAKATLQDVQENLETGQETGEPGDSCDAVHYVDRDITEIRDSCDGGAAKAPTIVLDNRGLEPPQPMIRTLHALERCKSGQSVQIHNDRVPMFLIEELKSLNYPFEVEEQPDGTAIVVIHKT